MRFKDLTKIIGIIPRNDDKVCKDVWGRGKECRSSVGRILVLAEKRELDKLKKKYAIPG
jgi:hypothetical protein